MSGVKGEERPNMSVRESLELLRAIIDSSTDAIFTKDLLGRYTLINLAGARFLGFKPEDVVGKRDDELLPYETALPTLRRDQEVLAAGRVTSYEDREEIAGVERVWRSTKGILRGERGEPIGLYGIARDVSEHLRLVDALRESEARCRSAAEGLLDAFFVLQARRGVDRHVEDFAYQDVNERGERLLKVSRAAVVGKTLRDFPPPFMTEELFASCVRVLETGKTEEQEVRTGAGDERRAFFTCQLIPLEDGVAITARDVTEKRQVEAQLLLTGRMAAVGALASGVAHEVNNPLAYVLSNLAFLCEELESLDAFLPKARLEELRAAVREALEGAERVRTIVADLKTFSRVDAGTAGLLDVRQSLDAAANLLMSRIRPRAQLEKHYGDVPLVQANEAALSQICLNLLLNALNALPGREPERHRITLRTGTDAGGAAVIEVEDSGAGLEPELLEHIFDPFFAPRSVDARAGMGLSACQTLARALGGDVAVQSAPGRGTQVRVTLPAGPTARE